MYYISIFVFSNFVRLYNLKLKIKEGMFVWK